MCSPLCGVATPRVLRTLLRVDFLPEELQGRGFPWDLVHGLSPTLSRRSFREEASLETLNLKEPLQCGRSLGEFFVDIRPSIYHGLEHHAMFRSEKRGREPLPTGIQTLGENLYPKLKLELHQISIQQ